MAEQTMATPDTAEITVRELASSVARKMIETGKFDIRFFRTICEELVAMADEMGVRKVVPRDDLPADIHENA